MEHERKLSYGRLGVGIFFVIVGVGLMLNNFEIFNNVPFWKFWPVIPIAIGLGKLFDARFAEEYHKAFWMLFMGGWFLISELHIFGLSYSNSWPILLIGGGIGLLWKSFHTCRPNIVKEQSDGK